MEKFQVSRGTVQRAKRQTTELMYQKENNKNTKLTRIGEDHKFTLFRMGLVYKKTWITLSLFLVFTVGFQVWLSMNAKRELSFHVLMKSMLGNKNNYTNKENAVCPKVISSDYDMSLFQYIRLSKSEPPIDAVFLYVNSSDPIFIQELGKYTDEPDMSRYRDIGQLKYGMRSIFMYAPWIRTIYVVVSNRETQTPQWLNTSSELVEVIEHKEIWPYNVEDTLPSFNSHAMEWSLLNIPNVSELIYFFNDDFSLLNPIDPQQHIFGKDGGQILYEGKEATRFFGKTARTKSLAFTRGLFNRKFNFKISRRKGLHVPWLMNITVMKMMYSHFESEIRQMYEDGPFRTDHDLQTMFAYQQYIRSISTEVNVNVCNNRLIFKGLIDGKNYNNRIYRNVTESKNETLFLCLNDSFDNPSDDVINDAVKFYDELYPIKAPWELA